MPGLGADAGEVDGGLVGGVEGVEEFAGEGEAVEGVGGGSAEVLEEEVVEVCWEGEEGGVGSWRSRR